MNAADYFFELFIKELEKNPRLRHYHRIINSDKKYLFRRAYYQQRLEYILNNVDKENALILDVGCGYGTTSLLLGMQGHKVIGTTLEYYFDEIENRLNYWKDHFDISKLEFKYENILKAQYEDKAFDYIIAQDTLHHIEPIDNAMKVFNRILKDNGKLLISEENGDNIINNLKNFKRRGFNRIIDIYDEKLNEKMLFGNENTRGISKWERVFHQNGFEIEKENTEYLRLFPPCYFRKHRMEEIIEKEQKLFKKSRLLRKYFFFGINLTALKKQL